MRSRSRCAWRLPSPFTLRLPVALSVSFADSSPTGGAKNTPVGAGQVVVRQTCSQLRLTRCSPGLTAVRLAPPAGELARRPQGGETERGTQAQLTERAAYAPILPTGRPYGPARPFERSFWKGNAQFSALLHDLHGLHGLHGFIYPVWFERFAWFAWFLYPAWSERFA